MSQWTGENETLKQQSTRRNIHSISNTRSRPVNGSKVAVVLEQLLLLQQRWRWRNNFSSTTINQWQRLSEMPWQQRSGVGDSNHSSYVSILI